MPLNLPAVMHVAAGDPGRILRMIMLIRFVNAILTFSDHPKVVKGCSDHFAAVCDSIGGHTRSAIGVGSLPGNMPVEIEAGVEIAA
jgi:enamine deaminase RidA (YjgF/YER057c/UK114 family)